MEDIRISELLDKYKKFREKKHEQFHIDFGNNLVIDLNTLFILPQLEKWEKDRKVTSNFVPYEILIKIKLNLPVCMFSLGEFSSNPENRLNQ